MPVSREHRQKMLEKIQVAERILDDLHDIKKFSSELPEQELLKKKRTIAYLTCLIRLNWDRNFLGTKINELQSRIGEAVLTADKDASEQKINECAIEFVDSNFAEIRKECSKIFVEQVLVC